MSAPDKIIKLVERFDRNIDAYKQGKYNETQVRREFIDPFFKALGWDVANERGYAEAYKEVVHEDAIKVGQGTKAPDYSFRIGGARKFFVEAKRPSIDIKDDIHPAFQLRRYAWSAKLPLSILTDFEEFAVYDTRIKPNKNDKASNARVMYVTFREYPEKWEEIASIFSLDSILKGSFDKYVESGRKKRGTAEVDDAFLSEIESWRDSLARNIALRNTQLENRVLNDVVQKTIDRILFLRICEDRGVENYGQLMALLNGANIYSRLSKLFLRADERYNSGLFHFSSEKNRQDPDEISLQLAIDDKSLKDIIKRLYYPESPYEFSVLPADILGQVYERFLGKVIRLTPGHRAVVEDKPEVRKAGGVYYTPTYIVDYIVKNTVGKLVEGKTPKQAEKLKILDPACGSGSFLLGAYQYLMDWHLEQYTAENPEKYLKSRSPKIYQVRSGDWRLSTSEKKRILLNNIYGVDIDTQAVEVTKLSLLLKVLEGETDETLKSQLKLFHERALPDLGNNIKCGNSLIGSDFYEGQQLSILSEDEMYKVNAFDWEKEFPEVWSEIWSEPSASAHASTQFMHSKNSKTGGFDAVIGNPPYALIGSDKPKEQFYFSSGKYTMISYKINTHLLFLEKGLNLLQHKDSSIGFIIPKSLVFNTYFSKARSLLLSNYAITKIVEIREKVFGDAEVGDSILFFARKSEKPTKNILSYYRVANVFPTFMIVKKYETPQDELLMNSEAQFFNMEIRIKVPTKILSEIAIVSNGLNPGNVRHILLSRNRETIYHKKMLLGRDIQKYSISWSGNWVNYNPNLKNSIKVSDIKSKKGMTPQKKIDFALRSPDIYKPNKILVRKTADHIIASFDPDNFYFDSLSYSIRLIPNIKYSIFYILGLINSKLLRYIHDSFSKNKNKVFAKVLATNLKKLPIPIINFCNPLEKSQHDKMVALVEQMLDLHNRLNSSQGQHEKTLLQRQIEATDQQIDQLVYELYDLTEEDIHIVEGK